MLPSRTDLNNQKPHEPGEWFNDRFRLAAWAIRRPDVFAGVTLASAVILSVDLVNRMPDGGGTGLATFAVICLLIALWLKRTELLSQDHLLSRIPLEHRKEAVRVRMRLWRNGIELGRDDGYVWSQGSMLGYVGNGCDWEIPNSKLTPVHRLEAEIGTFWFTVDIDGKPLRVDLTAADAIRPRLQQVLDFWRASAEPAPERIFADPPLFARRRTLGWYLDVLSERVHVSRIIFLLIMAVLFVTKVESFRLQVILLIAMATLHAVVGAYRRLKDEDEVNRIHLQEESLGIRRRAALPPPQTDGGAGPVAQST